MTKLCGTYCSTRMFGPDGRSVAGSSWLPTVATTSTSRSDNASKSAAHGARRLISVPNVTYTPGRSLPNESAQTGGDVSDAPSNAIGLMGADGTSERGVSRCAGNGCSRRSPFKVSVLTCSPSSSQTGATLASTAVCTESEIALLNPTQTQGIPPRFGHRRRSQLCELVDDEIRLDVCKNLDEIVSHHRGRDLTEDNWQLHGATFARWQIADVGKPIEHHRTPHIRIQPTGHRPKPEICDLPTRGGSRRPHDLVPRVHEFPSKRYQRMQMAGSRRRCHENAHPRPYNAHRAPPSGRHRHWYRRVPSGSHTERALRNPVVGCHAAPHRGPIAVLGNPVTDPAFWGTRWLRRPGTIGMEWVARRRS